jgi:hypothetical protein
MYLPIFPSRFLPRFTIDECFAINWNMLGKRSGVRRNKIQKWHSCCDLAISMSLGVCPMKPINICWMKMQFTVKLKRIAKTIPDGLMLVLVPKIEPRTIAPMNRVVNKPIGMANVFLRYQIRLVNEMKSFIKNTVRKI